MGIHQEFTANWYAGYVLVTPAGAIHHFDNMAQAWNFEEALGVRCEIAPC